MSADANTLLAQAKCYLCLGISLAEALQLALLSQIASSGATNNISTPVVDPNAAGLVPSNPNAASTFYQDPAVGTGTNVWNWSVTNQTWFQFSV